VNETIDLGKKIWSLSPEKKAKYARPKNYQLGCNSGYVGENVELLSSASIREIRESYNFRPVDKRVLISNRNFHSLSINIAQKFVYFFTM